MSRSVRTVLLDTSVAVAVCTEDHAAHQRGIDAIGDRRVGLAGHAWFETFSVLTRLPPPQRRAPSDVCTLLRTNFPASSFLTDTAQRAFIDELTSLSIAGGAIYDALVGLAARVASQTLLTRDQRALSTYQALGIDIELLT